MSDLIMVINNELQSVAPPSIKEFCMAAPRGAYTTMKISNGYLAVDFDVHIERLIKSIAAVHASLNSCYADYYAALEGQDIQVQSSSVEAAALQAAMLPSLLLALATAETRYGRDTSKIATIVISPVDQTPNNLSKFSLNIHIAVCENTAAVSLPEQENKTSLGTFAVVLGGPREVPIGKDSGWVAQRQSLETLRPPGAAEVLLITQQGDLLEGLVTNLYIITVVQQEGRKEEIVLQTAGMDSGVVWGTMRKRVLHAAEEVGLTIVEKAPAVADRGLWQEAFLTNALRGVQPLNRIECDSRNVWGLDPWEIEFSEVPGPWTAKIQALVEVSLQLTDLRKLSVPPLKKE